MAIISENAFIKRETIFGEREIAAYQTDDFGNIPQIVYKYLDLSLSTHRASVEKTYAWFADPLNFNDPYDCTTSFAFHLLAENEGLCRGFFEAKLKNQYSGITASELEFEVNKNVQFMVSKKGDYEFFKQMDRDAPDRKKMLSEFGIFCTCMINDNILLWSHYSNKHTGICLGLNAYALLSSFEDRGSGEVKYQDFPLIPPPEDDNDQAILDTFQPIFFNKAKFWNYELEYRFLQYPCKKRDISISNAIESIYFGINTPYDDEKFIIDLCKVLNKGIKLFKAEPAFFKYELEFIAVDY